MDQTVNLTSLTSVVRIYLFPPHKRRYPYRASPFVLREKVVERTTVFAVVRASLAILIFGIRPRRGDPACGVSADTLKVHLYKYKARRVRARERPTAATLCRGSRRETAIQRKHPKPRRLVAARRHGGRRAALAALPAAPAAPLSQKSRFAAIFGNPILPLAGFRRMLIISTGGFFAVGDDAKT